MENLPEFIENCPDGKQIDELLDIKNMQKRPQAPKPIFWTSKSSKSPKSGFFGKCAQRSNVCDSFLLFFKNMPYVTFDGRVRFSCFS